MSKWWFASPATDPAASEASLPFLLSITGGFLVLYQDFHEEILKKNPGKNPTALITRHGERLGLERGKAGRYAGLCPDCL